MLMNKPDKVVVVVVKGIWMVVMTMMMMIMMMVLLSCCFQCQCRYCHSDCRNHTCLGQAGLILGKQPSRVNIPTGWHCTFDK